MKIAAQRHEHLDNRSLKTSHHIDCQCGVIFSHEYTKGTTAQCPSCNKTKDIKDIDQPAI